MSRYGQWYQDTGSVTLAQAVGDVVTIPTGGMERLTVELAASNDSAVDQFQIQVKAHPSGSFVTLHSAGADFTTPTGLIVEASGDITALAANSSGAFVLRVMGIYQVKLRAAQAAGDATTLTYYIGGN